MDSVLERIDGFCDAVPRHWTTATDLGPLRLFVRDGTGWPFYARPIPGAGRVTAADVERVRARQRELGVPQAFEWLPAASPTMADAVRAAGLPVMVCPLLVLDGPPVEVPLPPGRSARLLGPMDADLVAATHAVRTVTQVAFGARAPGPPTAQDVIALRSDLAAGAVARVLVEGPGGPVAAGGAQRAGDAVELVGIATAAAHRGRGIGAAVTSLLAGAACDAGADLVFLAAADDAASRVYQRVGFRRVGECCIADAAA